MTRIVDLTLKIGEDTLSPPSVNGASMCSTNTK